VSADAGEAGARPTWPDGFVATPDDRRAVLVLSGLRGITPARLVGVAARRGSASATLEEIRAGRAGSENDMAFANTCDPDSLERAVRSAGARLVPWGSAEYPPQLVHLADPPAVLYVVGRAPPDPTRAVAVVGARGASDLGKELAFEIGRSLSLAGVTVVSGAARGIDSAAHRGSLDAGGPTLAVLGSGIDVAYPRQSRALLDRIAASGTVVTEYAPGTQPEPRNFPARNRVVAALCAATVVVEGATGSGSMITADHAMDLGRDVYAVPGAVTNPLAEVPLRLIRDGAHMIRGPEDLLADLGLEISPSAAASRADVSESELAVLETLAGPTLPDRVASALAIGLPEALAALMRLELRGLVRNVGGRYERTFASRAASG
jgi:DNA processing protein